MAQVELGRRPEEDDHRLVAQVGFEELPGVDAPQQVRPQDKPDLVSWKETTIVLKEEGSGNHVVIAGDFESVNKELAGTLKAVGRSRLHLSGLHSQNIHERQLEHLYPNRPREQVWFVLAFATGDHDNFGDFRVSEERSDDLEVTFGDWVERASENGQLGFGGCSLVH
jgi:hypothetical protein